MKYGKTSFGILLFVRIIHRNVSKDAENGAGDSIVGVSDSQGAGQRNCCTTFP